jgi:hypothetical protein
MYPICSAIEFVNPTGSRSALPRPPVRLAGSRCWKRHGNDPVRPGERPAFANLLKTGSFSRFSG